MVNLFDELVAIVRALQRAKIDSAVCGGMAVAIHGLARTTKDIDVLLLREDLARELEAVRALGFILDGGILPMGADEKCERDHCCLSKVIDKKLLTLDLLIVNPLLQQAFEAREYYRVARGQVAGRITSGFVRDEETGGATTRHCRSATTGDDAR